jgi:flagellar biosynthesis/type III secretory pathway protein FliH
LNKARNQLILGFVDTYLRLNDEEEEAYRRELETFSPIEREKVTEMTMSWKEAAEKKGLQQGLEQGLEQGLQEGLEKGRLQGMLTLITHQIERRIGPIGSETQQRISELNADQLERLGDELVDFASADDLAKWLNAI